MPRIHGSIEERRRAAGLTSLPQAARLSCALVLTLLLAKGGPVEATPESRASVLFLLISPSARVNGMGQAGVALPDEPAGYYNPGAAALSSPTRTVQSRHGAGDDVELLPGVDHRHVDRVVEDAVEGVAFGPHAVVL